MLQKSDIKTLKLYTQIEIFKEILLKKQFIFFFNFKSLTSKTQLDLKLQLQKYNFKSILIKKNSFKNLCQEGQFIKFLNLCQDNTLLIYADKEGAGKELLKELLENQNFILLLAKIENNFYRPSLITKYSNLSDKVILEPLVNIISILEKLKITLTLQKRNLF
jgi:ribosomal protein L10